MFVLAPGAVGASAGAELEFALGEVAEELVPLTVCGFAVLLGWSKCPPSGDVSAVVVDHVVVIDRDVGLGGRDRVMAKDLGGDVNGQAGCDGLGGEDPPEVVGAELGRCAVAVGDPRGGDQLVEQFDGVGGVDRDPACAPRPLE